LEFLDFLAYMAYQVIQVFMGQKVLWEAVDVMEKRENLAK